MSATSRLRGIPLTSSIFMRRSSLYQCSGNHHIYRQNDMSSTHFSPTPIVPFSSTPSISAVIPSSVSPMSTPASGTTYKSLTRPERLSSNWCKTNVRTARSVLAVDISRVCQTGLVRQVEFYMMGQEQHVNELGLK
ncbi:hypothetical protein EG68_10169 [Paragonimus skrjabini miyazakii]|uniref:Uncharacterized protein n=1 Tax=Paragonimus skrjabini miyazakii TaxID=59628 RepID=A0A8S9YJY8_9TREM|nr:hypothetical protein EG68_10169 [Paragonimus skrjabini miyazakii]